MSIRKPANDYYQMLPSYESKYKPIQNNIDFQSAKEILKKKVCEMVLKRRFERIYNMMGCNSYMKNQEVPENKEIFVYGFKHTKTENRYLNINWTRIR